MKFNTPNTGYVNSDQMLGGVGMSIKASAKSIRTLIDTLYRYKEEAVARELISNGRDAHHMRDAMLKPSMQPSHYQSLSAARSYLENAISVEWYAPRGKPLEIHVPTENEPYFELKDFGVGLPLEKIMGRIALDEQGNEILGPNNKVVWTGGMYTRLFDSPKDEDNTQIGGFGLGAKSPSTIADSYTVETRFNGDKYIVFIYEDKDRIPTADLVTCDERGLPVPIPMGAEEFNGTTVRVPVSLDRIPKFKRALSKVLRFVDVPYVFTNVSVTVDRPEFAFDFAETRVANSGSGNHYAVQGGVVYPIDMNMLSLDITETFGNMVCDTYTFFPIGSVNMQPSREDLEYDRHTIEVLEDYLGRASVKMVGFLKDYRVGTTLSDRIRAYNFVKTFFGRELMEKTMSKGAIVDTERHIKMDEVIADSLGVPKDVSSRADYLYFGSSIDVLRSGEFEARAFTMSRSRSSSVQPSHIIPNIEDGTKQTFVVMGSKAPLQACVLISQRVRDTYTQMYPENWSRKLAYVTPCSITQELRKHFVKYFKKVTFEDVVESVKADYLVGALEPKEMMEIGAKKPDDFIQVFYTETDVTGLSKEEISTRCSEYVQAMYDKWMDSKFNEIAKRRMDAKVHSRATEWEIVEFLEDIFQSYEAAVYHTDNVEMTKGGEITLERVQKLKGITSVYSKVHPMNGTAFFNLIEEAREKGQRIPFVYLRGYDLHEDSRTTLFTAPSSVYYEYDKLRDLVDCDVYAETIVGVRITGRKFFETHAELFVPVHEMFEDLVGEDTITNKMVKQAVCNVYDACSGIIPSRTTMERRFEFMRDINTILPNTFEDWMLQVRTFAYNPRSRYNMLVNCSKTDMSHYGRLINDRLKSHPKVLKAVHDVKRYRAFWASFDEKVRAVGEKYDVSISGRLEEHSYANILEYMEKERLYALAKLQPRDIEREIQVDWFKRHGVVTLGATKISCVSKRLKELYYSPEVGCTLGEGYDFSIAKCRQVPEEVLDQLYIDLCIYERTEALPGLLNHFHTPPVETEEAVSTNELETENVQSN